MQMISTSHLMWPLDLIKNMINRDNKFLTKSEKLRTHTLGCELGNISEGKPKRWTVTNISDVSSVAHSIAEAFVAIGIPYFEKFSDEKYALEILSGDEKASSIHSPFHESKALHSLIESPLHSSCPALWHGCPV